MKRTINFLAKPKPRLRWPRLKLRLFGLWLFSFAISVVLLSFWPAISFEFNYRLDKIKKIHFVLDPSDLKKLSFKLAYAANKDTVQILSPIDRDFGLVIPKVKINSEIFANIDLNNEEEHESVLKEGVAHGLGSVFPGQKGTIFIFGHSTDLSLSLNQTVNSVFYPLNKLEKGDEIDIFYNGWRYVYQVTEKKVVEPEEVSLLGNSEGERLVLQTCWPPGTRLQRLTIIAEPAYNF